jgi:uracil-DNA glycosylase family 4
MNVTLPLGPHKAKLMIVGGLPEPDDELTGEPFYRLRDYLEGLLTKAGLTLSDAYLTLSVKCPGKPRAKDTKTCSGWLYQEIQDVEPKVVLTLGQMPTSLLLRDKKLSFSRVLGQLLPVECYTVAPWHSLVKIYGSGLKVDTQTISLLKKVKHVLDSVE